jgi:Ca2+-binding RTX toxin-like protein
VPTSPPTTGALPVFKPVSSWVMGGPTQKWIHGTDGNDVLAGTAGNDMIDGRKGGDTMSGGLGDDVYDIGPGEADRPVELAGQGIDTVLVRGSAWTLGTEFENLVAHSWQPTRLVGNDKDNVILGNRGDDVLVGGKGADLLTGGAGRDVFVYRDLLEGGDVVRDFQRGVDRLDLRELTAKLSGEAVVFDKLASGLAVSVSVSGKTTALALLEGVTDGQLTLGTDVLVG